MTNETIPIQDLPAIVLPACLSLTSRISLTIIFKPLAAWIWFQVLWYPDHLGISLLRHLASIRVASLSDYLSGAWNKGRGAWTDSVDSYHVTLVRVLWPSRSIILSVQSLSDGFRINTQPVVLPSKNHLWRILLLISKISDMLSIIILFSYVISHTIHSLGPFCMSRGDHYHLSFNIPIVFSYIRFSPQWKRDD